MSDLTVASAIGKREALETIITDLVRDFEAETGMLVRYATTCHDPIPGGQVVSRVQVAVEL